MATIGRNARGQITINGVVRFPSAIYDSQARGLGGSDMQGHVTARDYARYRFDLVIHVQSGTFGNGLKLCDALAPLGMYCLATGNFFGNFTFDPTMFEPQYGFDVQSNPTYTTPVQGTGPFNTLFPQKPAGLGVYMADEPSHDPSGHTSGNRLSNGSFSTNLNGWTINAIGGGTGTVTRVTSGGVSNGAQAQLAGGSSGVEFSTTATVTTAGRKHKIWWSIGQGSVRVRFNQGSTNLYDAVHGPGRYHAIVTPAGTSVEFIFSVGAGVTAGVDEVGVSWEADPAPVPQPRALDDCLLLQSFYHGIIPSMPTWTTVLNDDGRVFREWCPLDFTDMLGCDIYTAGQGPEQDPASSGTLNPNGYGYMHWAVSEAGAYARYYNDLWRAQYNRISLIVLEANKFGNTSRHMTITEQISHLAAGLAELRGNGIIVWWAMGGQAGAIHQMPFVLYTGDGSRTVFPTNAGYAEEKQDVEVQLNGVVQPLSSYTVAPLGDYTLARSGNFWVFANPAQVTMNVAPAAGVPITVTYKVWPTGKQNALLQFLEDATKFLRFYEQLFIQLPSETLLTNNSTWAADFLTWRRAYCNFLRTWPGGPVWQFGVSQRYQDEYDRLNQSPPDYTLSAHMQDQRGPLRVCCWDAIDYAIVATSNVDPNPLNNAQLTFAKSFTRAEVLFEGRDAIVAPGGRTLIDTWGGASSMKQGPFGMGHIYKLYFGGGMRLVHRR